MKNPGHLKAVIGTALLIGTVVFFVWAPVMPFERLVTAVAPASPGACSGLNICPVSPYDEWAKSYGSLSYVAFGFGTAPFGAPVAVERNGVVSELLFNAKNLTDSISFPSSFTEPIPILRVNSVVVHPNSAPLGGTVVQRSVTNLGTGETAQTYWVSQYAVQTAGSYGTVPPGKTLVLNYTSWTGPVPAENSVISIVIQANVMFPGYWLNAYHQQSVTVVYSP